MIIIIDLWKKNNAMMIIHPYKVPNKIQHTYRSQHQNILVKYLGKILKKYVKPI